MGKEKVKLMARNSSVGR